MPLSKNDLLDVVFNLLQLFQSSIFPPNPVKVAHGDTSYKTLAPEKFLILADFFGEKFAPSYSRPPKGEAPSGPQLRCALSP